MKFAFMCHKKCFGISDRFIRSKNTTPSLLHFSTSNISFPLSPAPFAALALNRAGLLTSASKKTPAVKNRTDLWWTYALFSSLGLCRTQRKTAPAEVVGEGGGRGDGAREREKAEWRGDALRSVSGFMELCISDPPPWIAIRDHSFWFYTFCCPALPLPSPSSTPLMKVSELSMCGHVSARVCARACVYGAHQCAHGSVPIFNDGPVWGAWWGQQSWEWTQTREGRAPFWADLPSEPGNSCVNGGWLKWTMARQLPNRPSES